MAANSWAYASVLAMLGAALSGASVSAYLFWKILKHTHKPPVIAAWLLVAIAGMSAAQIVEQTRVLVFRLSFDGVIDKTLFDALYDNLGLTVFSKLLFALALAAGTALKLALYCDRDEKEIKQFTFIAMGLVLVVWLTVGNVLQFTIGE